MILREKEYIFWLNDSVVSDQAPLMFVKRLRDEFGWSLDRAKTVTDCVIAVSPNTIHLYDQAFSQEAWGVLA